jgi:hypothetical protein
MSEQKTARVADVIEVKSWNGPNGTIWFHKIELDNGEIGEIGKKQENGIKVGDTLTYTAEQGQYGLKFKAVQANGFGGGGFKGGGSRGSTASFALSYAKDLAVANVNKSDRPLEMDALAAKIISVAAKFNAWLKENEQ